MSRLNISSGEFESGTAVPGAYSGSRKAAAIMDQAMRLHPDANPFDDDPAELSTPRSLLLDFKRSLFVERDLTSGSLYAYKAFSLMRTITRTGRAWSPNWSFRSGDPVGELVEYAENEVRWNEAPNCGGGALIEASGASNSCKGARCEGALPGELGSGGQLPDYWATLGSNTGTIDVIGRGVSNGWPYVELELSGTSGQEINIYTAQAGDFARVSSETATHSIGLQLVSGSTTNTTLTHYVSGMSGAGAVVENPASSVLSLTDVHRRFWLPATFASGSTASGSGRLRLQFSGTVTLRVRIFAPQIETGLVPSSPVFHEVETPAVSTRGAETVTGGLTSTRSSRAWVMDWDGTNGGKVRSAITEFLPNVPCVLPGKSFFPLESTTNQNRNPRFEGAVVGTPGTLPTNFTFVGSGNGISYAVAGLGEEDGVDYMDLRIYGTTTGNVFARMLLESSSQISASAGEAWTFSAGLKLISGALENFQAALYITEINGAGNILVRDITDDVDSNHRRFFGTNASTGSGTTAVLPGIWFNCTTIGTTVDFVIRIYAPQCEEKAYPTMPVLPEPGSPAVSTRAADALTLDGATWGAASGQAFSLGISARLPRPLGSYSYEALFEYGQDSNNAIRMGMDAVTQGEGRLVGVEASSTVIAENIGGVSSEGETFKTCFSWAQNDFHATSGGDAASESIDDTSAAHSYSSPKLSLAGRLSSSVGLNCHIDRVEFAPGQWSDAEVDAIAL
jgi:hypothetical protein